MKKTMWKILGAAVWLVSGGLGVLACATPADGPSADTEAADTEEELGQASSALGESGCATATAFDSQALGVQVCGSVNGGYSASAGTIYNRSTCPHQWIVEYPSSSVSLHARVYWNDTAPANQSECQAAHLTLGAYTYDGVSWGAPQTTSLHGVWLAPGVCQFLTDSGSDVLDSVPPGALHRLAGSAYQQTISGKTYRKVAVQLYEDGPCP
jgi:hypothetical protein